MIKPVELDMSWNESERRGDTTDMNSSFLVDDEWINMFWECNDVDGVKCVSTTASDIAVTGLWLLKVSESWETTKGDDEPTDDSDEENEVEHDSGDKYSHGLSVCPFSSSSFSS